MKCWVENNQLLPKFKINEKCEVFLKMHEQLFNLAWQEWNNEMDISFVLEKFELIEGINAEIRTEHFIDVDNLHD